MLITRLLAVSLLTGSPALAQTPTDPFPTPIPTTEGVIKVRSTEFASLPDVDGAAARLMLLVGDMRGLLYSVSYNGQTVTPYLDLRDPRWAVSVQSQGNERGFQSFAFHP